MALPSPGLLDRLPTRATDMFTIIKFTPSPTGPRLGRLAIRDRKVTETPHYLAITSRGTVPHLTPDTFERDTRISGVYVGLEDCTGKVIERAHQRTPPLYSFKPSDGLSPLRRFTALSDDALLVLGARRTPPVAAPAANPNTDTTISVCTAVGFKLLKADDYARAAEDLEADIVVGLGDIPYGRALGSKRMEKATDRNIQWLQDHVALRKSCSTEAQADMAAIFASLLPVTCANQQFFIDSIEQEARENVSGLAIYSSTTLEDLPYTLSHLPRLGFMEPKTPHDVLNHIRLGLDILTIPFVTVATDAGIALSFSFPIDLNPRVTIQPLGNDMWSPSHSASLVALTPDCTCYTCTTHHRAYIQHLLVAKEMLGWVLLQIHNHHVIDRFFDGIRRSIASETFEDDAAAFAKLYEPLLPEKTGQGPRVRGYQFKAEGPGEPKRNVAPFQPTMNDAN